MTTSLVDTLLWTEVDGAGKEMVVLAVVPLVWYVWKIALGLTRWSRSFIHQTIEYLHRWSSSVKQREADIRIGIPKLSGVSSCGVAIVGGEITDDRGKKLARWLYLARAT